MKTPIPRAQCNTGITVMQLHVPFTFYIILYNRCLSQNLTPKETFQAEFYIIVENNFPLVCYVFLGIVSVFYEGDAFKNEQ